MNTYRVTYTESVLREVLIDAEDAEQAEDLAMGQIELGKHHHAVDVWDDDWRTELCQSVPSPTRTCFECGKPCA
jgi:hypothetical protein